MNLRDFWEAVERFEHKCGDDECECDDFPVLDDVFQGWNGFYWQRRGCATDLIGPYPSREMAETARQNYISGRENMADPFYRTETFDNLFDHL